MASIRVLHCVAGLDHGGYESLIMNLYRNIDREKVQFDFVSSFPGVYEPEIEALGGRIHRIPFITQKGPFVYTAALDRVLRAEPRYPIVHSHMDKFSGLVMKRAAKAGIPVRIAHSHNTKNEGGLAFQLVKDHYGRMVLPWATDLFACSKAAADWMFGEKAAGARILFNGVQPEDFAPSAAARAAVRAELGLTESTFVAGHVGRFTEQKNHAFLLEIFAALHARRPDSALLLAGDGPLRPKMAETARRLGLESAVRFLGPRQDVPALLSAMDCFIFPSHHEGLPVTLVEAQAAGPPAAPSPTRCASPRWCAGWGWTRPPIPGPPRRWSWRKAVLPPAAAPPGPSAGRAMTLRTPPAGWRSSISPAPRAARSETHGATAHHGDRAGLQRGGLSGPLPGEYLPPDDDRL